jgi:hypothetical protein
MRSVRLAVLVIVALLVCTASDASAQRTRPRAAASPAKIWELGFDSQLSLSLEDPGFVSLTFPAGSIRAGVFTSDVVSIEPFFGLSYLKPEGVDAITRYELGVGGLYHFSAARTARQVYVRPFLAIVGASAGGQSDSDVGIGVGAGIKWPRMNGRLALRGEANIATMNDATSLNFLFGLSFFPR